MPAERYASRRFTEYATDPTQQKANELSMKIPGTWTLAILFAMPICAFAADRSIGQVEFDSKCAMCHGAIGKGDGWFSAQLKKSTPSLVRLKRNNGGVFPFDSVYQVIDGRKEVLAHGPRQMPVWGAVYRVDSERQYDMSSGQYVADESVTRSRILALIEYVSRLQE